MATVLDQYRERQLAMRTVAAEGNLPIEQLLMVQELNYRVCVLETFQMFSKTAPVTMNTKAMGYHFQLVDAYIRFIESERRFGLKADEKRQKQRETALHSLEQVIQEGRKKFGSFSPTNKEQYKSSIASYINTVLPVWMQYRETYISLSKEEAK